MISFRKKVSFVKFDDLMTIYSSPPSSHSEMQVKSSGRMDKASPPVAMMATVLKIPPKNPILTPPSDRFYLFLDNHWGHYATSMIWFPGEIGNGRGLSLTSSCDTYGRSIVNGSSSNSRSAALNVVIICFRRNRHHS